MNKTRQDCTAEQLASQTSLWSEPMLADVGRALSKNRLVGDDPNDITYRPLDVQTSGFVVTARPRRIDVREVAGYASGSCRSCHGVGYSKVMRRVTVGTNESGDKVMKDFHYDQSCGCADKRYKKQHPNMLIDSRLGEWIALDDLVVRDAETADEDD